MTEPILTRETVEAMLASVSPYPFAQSEKPARILDGLGNLIAEVEPTAHRDAGKRMRANRDIMIAAPDLAAALLAAWDREAKLREALTVANDGLFWANEHLAMAGIGSVSVEAALEAVSAALGDTP